MNCQELEALKELWHKVVCCLAGRLAAARACQHMALFIGALNVLGVENKYREYRIEVDSALGMLDMSLHDMANYLDQDYYEQNHITEGALDVLGSLLGLRSVTRVLPQDMDTAEAAMLIAINTHVYKMYEIFVDPCMLSSKIYGRKQHVN
jgi:hypothetical protein